MTEGRRFRGQRKVRLGDVSTTGRLRLDALTRYTQDVSDDDTTAAGLAPDPAWVVRRTEVSTSTSAQLGEELEFVTYCSGLGGRWAERRLDITGAWGACYEVATLWICVDPVSGRPQRLTEQFLTMYGPSAGGRTVNARLSNPKPPAGLDGRPWPLRSVDFDTMGHVNNAAYWAAVEEVLDGGDAPEPFVATMEYSSGLTLGDEVELVEADHEGGWLLWLRTSDGNVAASASFRPRR